MKNATVDHELPQMSALKREPLHERVYEELRARLLEGAFEPGQKLPIRVLAKALNTSEVPVREALRRLTSERGLEVLPTGTAAVPAMTRAGFQALTEVRVALEGLAAELAAKRASPEDLAAMEQLCVETEQAEQHMTTDLKHYLEVNQRFHFAVYRASHNDELLQQISMLWLRIGPFLNRVNDWTQTGIDPWHRNAVDAIKAGKAKSARKAIESDLKEGAALLIKHSVLS